MHVIMLYCYSLTAGTKRWPAWQQLVHPGANHPEQGGFGPPRLTWPQG